MFHFHFCVAILCEVPAALGANKETVRPSVILRAHREPHLHDRVRAVSLCIAAPVSAGAAVVTPLAGPFLFQFASRCLAAAGDTAHLSDVFFLFSFLYQAAAGWFAFAVRVPSVNFTASF